MTRRKVDVTYKLIIGYILIILFILWFFISMSGCGTRKSSVKIEETTNNQTEKSSSEGKVVKETQSSEKNSSKEKNAVVDENMKQKITELYDENGKLKSRITEFEKQKQSNTSSKSQKSLKTLITRVDSVFNTTNYKHYVITERKKEKEADADKSVVRNLGGWGIVLTLGIVMIGAVFLYFYLRRKSKGG